MCIGTAVFASPCHVAASHVPDDMATDTITVGNPQKTASFAAVLAHMRHTLRCDAHMMHTMRLHTPHTHRYAHICTGTGRGHTGGYA